MAININIPKPTYDTSEVNPTTDRNYITDADETKLANQSGTNTGDETTSTIQTKRPLKTIAGKSLEGTGNETLGISDIDGLTTALNNKVDTVVGKGLSDENYTLTEKNKLLGIEIGAQVNTINDVIAGTNVTIDKTDPLNPIISASGGGGNIDGGNASSIPIFMGVDGGGA
jgi:hypothetical protein